MGTVIQLADFRRKAAPGADKSDNAPAPAQASGDPVYEIYHEILSPLPLRGDKRQAYLRKLLGTLNSEFALHAQRTPGVEYMGIYKTNLLLFASPLTKEAFDEVRDTYGAMIKTAMPRRYQAILRKNGNGQDAERLRDAFGRAVIADSPAYSVSAGLLKKIFPDAVIAPKALQSNNGVLSCIELNVPVKEGQDLRAIVERTLAARPTI